MLHAFFMHPVVIPTQVNFAWITPRPPGSSVAGPGPAALALITVVQLPPMVLPIPAMIDTKDLYDA